MTVTCARGVQVIVYLLIFIWIKGFPFCAFRLGLNWEIAVFD